MNKEHILLMIRDKQILLSNEIIEPHDYISLKSYAIQTELAQELEALEGIAAGDDDFEFSFKERCKARALKNAGSCLSFTEMPEGAVNQLYWDIACLIAPLPQTIGSLLGILMPQVIDKIVPDYVLQKDLLSGRVSLNNVKFKVEAIDTLEEAPSLKRLGDFVIVGSKLFDVNDIAQLKFNFHSRLYESLRAGHPELADHLYKHNPSLRVLADRVSILQGRGQTPFEAITVFIRELRLSGTHGTGMTYAARNAGIAFATFMGYLDVIPVDVKERLLALSSASGKSISGVINDLRMGRCVEVAAGQLQQILEHAESRDFLNSRPLLPDNYLSNIAKEYAKGGLATNALDSSSNLPECFLAEALSHVVINDDFDFISLLLSFPPTLYFSMLQHARIDLISGFLNLASQIYGGVLNEEQKQAFFSALIKQYQKFPLCISFYIQCGEAIDGLIPLLAEVPQDERLLALKRIDADGNTVLHKMAFHLVSLQAILALYPESERLLAVKERDMQGNTVLHKAASSPAALQAILALYTESERLLALKEIDGQGNTVLHKTAFYPVSLQAILALYPESERLLALKERNGHGETVLHRAAFFPEALQAILALYPENEMLLVVKERDMQGNTVLHLVASSPTSLRAILALYPESERILAVKERNERGETVLHNAAIFPAALQAILALYPENERLLALNKKDNFGLTVFQRGASNPESVLIILQSLPIQDRPAARQAMQARDVREREPTATFVLNCMAAAPALLGSYFVAMSAFKLTLSTFILLPPAIVTGAAVGLALGAMFFAIGGLVRTTLELSVTEQPIDNPLYSICHSMGFKLAVGLCIAPLVGIAAASLFLLNPALFSVAGYYGLAYGSTVTGAGLATTFGLFSKSIEREPVVNEPELQGNNDLPIQIPAV